MNDPIATSALVTEQPWRTSRRLVRWLAPFQIDVRSLAAMRIALGLTTLVDLQYRARLANVYFTDRGVFPRNAATDSSARLSLFAINGSLAWAVTLFALHMIVATMFTIGYRTRFATIAMLVFLYSLINRNPPLSNAGQNLEVWLLAWSILLPLGAAASVDARLARFERRSARLRRVCNVATLAILWQVLFVYWSAFTAKSDPTWTTDFTAVYFQLHSHFGTPLGFRLGQSTEITTAIALLTLSVEALGPVLALLSAYMPRTRTAVVAAFIALHLGIAATIYVSSFSAICIAGWLLFLPADFWDFMQRRLGWRVASAGWQRALAAPAAVIDRVGPRAAYLAPRRVAGLRLSRNAAIIAATVFAYVVLINVVSDMPKRLSRLLGPINRLPKLKQNWAVMAGAWQIYATVAIDVTLADGSSHRLRVEDAPGGDFDFTLPRGSAIDQYNRASLMPEAAGSVFVYRGNMLSDSVGGHVETIRAFSDYHRRCWNRDHPSPGQQITSLVTYYEYRKIPAPGDGFDPRAAFKRLPVDTWPTPLTAASKAAPIR